jgi:hypothetical protein
MGHSEGRADATVGTVPAVALFFRLPDILAFEAARILLGGLAEILQKTYQLVMEKQDAWMEVRSFYNKNDLNI